MGFCDVLSVELNESVEWEIALAIQLSYDLHEIFHGGSDDEIFHSLNATKIFIASTSQPTNPTKQPSHSSIHSSVQFRNCSVFKKQTSNLTDFYYHHDYSPGFSVFRP